MSINRAINIVTLLLLVVLSLPFAAQAQTVAGTILAARGEVYAVSAQGKRNLNRGDTIYAGDKLLTGADSRLLIRYTDNSAIALQSHSELRIETYQHTPGSAAGNTNSNQFLRGSMRMLTGAISKANPAGFKVRTPVAVIGVRGTEFNLAFICQSGQSCKLRVVTQSGLVTVQNNTGTTLVPAGQMVNVGSSSDSLQAVPAPAQEMCFGF